MEISAAKINEWKEHGERLKNKIAGMREKIQETTGIVITTVEVGVVSFGLGMARGYFGEEMSIVGVPVDLGLALVLHLVGFFGGGGKYGEHLHSAGNGALASYLTFLGASLGADFKKKQGATGTPQLGGSTTSKGLPQGSSTSAGFVPPSLDDAELSSLLRAA